MLDNVERRINGVLSMIENLSTIESGVAVRSRVTGWFVRLVRVSSGALVSS